MPKTIVVDDSEIREALSECVSGIVSAIRVALEGMPSELSADISDRGIVLAGGGALLRNLDKRIREETGVAVSTAADPLQQRGAWNQEDPPRFQIIGENFDRMMLLREPPPLSPLMKEV